MVEGGETMYLRVIGIRCRVPSDLSIAAPGVPGIVDIAAWIPVRKVISQLLDLSGE